MTCMLRQLRIGFGLATGLACMVSACTISAPTGTAPIGSADSVPPIPSPSASGYENPTIGRSVVLQIPAMHEAEVTRDLVYATRGNDELLLDLYRPPDASDPVPVVLVGGPPAFEAGKGSGQKVGWGQLIAASGLGAAVFDIRSDNFLASPQDPSRDVVAAIQYLRANAEELGIAADRLCTLGFSIGTAPWHLWAALHDRRPYIRCNVVYYGPMELRNLDFSMEPALVQEYSALTYLRRDGAEIAPMLIAKAGYESNQGINASIDRFVAEGRRLHARVTLLEHPEGVHGFDVQTDDQRTVQIMEATLDYFQHWLASE